MARELITDWSAYQAAIDRLLCLASHTLCIYDEDLVKVRLDGTGRLPHLCRLLQNTQPGSVRIALRNAEPFRRQQNHLIQLFAPYAHIITIQETAPQISGLRDSMILVDDQHALIRFDRDQARSKLLINEIDELRPYLQRFEEIWKEPGDVIGTTSLGL